MEQYVTYLLHITQQNQNQSSHQSFTQYQYLYQIRGMMQKLICNVCYQSKSELYQMANCKHQFCKECSISYIHSQADNFAQAKCLQQGCGAALQKDKPIYGALSLELQQKIGKFESFKYLQNNKQIKSCRAPDCKGFFTFKSENQKCNICGLSHCHKCLDLSHQGPCATKDKQQLLGLNFRQCPQCGIWVQKTHGCEYISCKCGMDFCYKCGAEFAKDPCRQRNHWERQFEMRQLLKKLTLSPPSSFKDLPCFTVRIFVLILLLPLSLLFWVLPLAVLSVVVALFVALFFPAVLINEACKIKTPCKRYCAYILAIVFYPLVGALMVVIFAAIVCLYPFCRTRYHHGMYDPFDSVLGFVSQKYVSLLVCLVGDK